MQTVTRDMPTNHKDFLEGLLETYSKKTGLHMFASWYNLRTWKKYSTMEVLSIIRVKQNEYDNTIASNEYRYTAVLEKSGMQNRFKDQSGMDIDNVMFNTSDIKILFLLWWEHTLKTTKGLFPTDLIEELTVYQIDVMKTINYFNKYSDEDRVKIYELLQDEVILPKKVQDIFLF